MKKLFEIDNSEKQRILEMHQNATRKNYLTEQQNSKEQPKQGEMYYGPETLGLTQENLNYILSNSDQSNYTFPGNNNLYVLTYGNNRESFDINVMTLGPVFQQGNQNVKLGIGLFYRGSASISVANKKLWNSTGTFNKAYGLENDSQTTLNNFVNGSSLPTGVQISPEVVSQYVTDYLSRRPMPDFINAMFNKTKLPSSGPLLAVAQSLQNQRR